MLYYLMYALGFTVTLAWNLLIRKRYSFDVKASILITVLTFLAGVFGALMMGKARDAIFGRDIINGEERSSVVCLFGALIFIPVFMAVVFKILKIDINTGLDYITFGTLCVLAYSKLGCHFDGCCYGIESDFLVVYNEEVGANVFAVQLFESACLFLILIIVELIVNFYPRYVRGTAYPIGAALYCVQRFFWEFMRNQEGSTTSDVLFGLTFWQLLCIVVFIASIAWLAVLCVKNKKITADREDLPRQEEEISGDAL